MGIKCFIYQGMEFDKIMQTPYNQLRQRQKERKQRINLSIDKPNLSLDTPRPFSFNPSLKKLKSSTSKSSRDRNSQQKRQAINLSKRKKLIHGLNQQIEESTLKVEQTNHRLLVEGSKCGNDLINLNRRKLQHLISQIKASNTSKHNNFNVPQVCLKKSKYNCVKQDKNVQKGQQQHVRLDFHKGSKQRKMLSRDNWLRRSAEREGKDDAQIKPVELNIEASKASINAKSTQKQIILYPKKSLVKTRTTCKTEQMIKSTPWTPMSFREPVSPKKKGNYQNVFNMNNLKGWQSFDQTEQCPFVHPLDWS